MQLLHCLCFVKLIYLMLYKQVLPLFSFQDCIYICTITGYWPSNVRACGFWSLPLEWQFSCNKCGEISALLSSGHLSATDEMCSGHAELQSFLKTPALLPPVFIGLSSVGRQVCSNNCTVLRCIVYQN